MHIGIEVAELADAALECAPPVDTLPHERAACAVSAYAALARHAALQQQPAACEALVAMLHGAASFDEDTVSTRVVVRICMRPMH